MLLEKLRTLLKYHDKKKEIFVCGMKGIRNFRFLEQ